MPPCSTHYPVARRRSPGGGELRDVKISQFLHADWMLIEFRHPKPNAAAGVSVHRPTPIRLSAAPTHRHRRILRCFALQVQHPSHIAVTWLLVAWRDVAPMHVSPSQKKVCVCQALEESRPFPFLLPALR